MLNPLRESFRDQMRGNACQEAITAVEFFVQDPPQPSTEPCFHYLPPARNRFDLQVLNESGRLVHLIQIDRCLYTVAEGRRCDCVLLTTEQAYFVEFKAADRDFTAGGNLRYARAADCVEQLEHTIKDFISRAIIPPGALVVAYACVGRTSQRPYPGADFLALSASFNNRFEGLPVRVRLLVENVLTVSKSTTQLDTARRNFGFPPPLPGAYAIALPSVWHQHPEPISGAFFDAHLSAAGAG